MIWLYGAVDDPGAAIASIDEPDRASLIVLEAGGAVTCIGSYMDSVDSRPSERALLDHDRVMQRMLSVCTVVPFRFNTVVAGDEEFHETLDRRAAELAELLGWLRGRVELAVRARCSASRPANEDLSGRSYLIGRRSDLIPEHLVELHHILLSRAVAATASGDGRQGFKGSYLVELGSVEDFCVEAKTAAEEIDGITDLSVTGPWAPYSFVTGNWTDRSPDPGPESATGGKHE